MHIAITHHDNLIFRDSHSWQLALRLCIHCRWDLLTHYNRIHDLIKSAIENHNYIHDSTLDITVVHMPGVHKSIKPKDSLKTRYKNPDEQNKEELNYHAYQDVGVSYVKSNYGRSPLQYASPQFTKYTDPFLITELKPQYVTTPADRIGYQHHHQLIPTSVGYQPPFTQKHRRVGRLHSCGNEEKTIEEWVDYIHRVMKSERSNRVRFLNHIDISFFRKKPSDDGYRRY